MADVPQKAGGMGEGSAPSGDGASRGNQRRRRRGGGRGRSNASGGKNPDPIADSKADPTAKILENAQHKQGEKDTGGTQTRARNSGSSHRKRGGRGRASGSIDKGPKPIPQPTAVPHAPTTPRTVHSTSRTIADISDAEAERLAIEAQLHQLLGIQTSKKLQISPSALSVVSPEQEHLKKLFLQAATKQGSASEAQKEIAECDPAAVAAPTDTDIHDVESNRANTQHASPRSMAPEQRGSNVNYSLFAPSTPEAVEDRRDLTISNKPVGSDVTRKTENNDDSAPLSPASLSSLGGEQLLDVHQPGPYSMAPGYRSSAANGGSFGMPGSMPSAAIPIPTRTAIGGGPAAYSHRDAMINQQATLLHQQQQLYFQQQQQQALLHQQHPSLVSAHSSMIPIHGGPGGHPYGLGGPFPLVGAAPPPPQHQPQHYQQNHQQQHFQQNQQQQHFQQNQQQQHFQQNQQQQHFQQNQQYSQSQHLHPHQPQPTPNPVPQLAALRVDGRALSGSDAADPWATEQVAPSALVQGHPVGSQYTVGSHQQEGPASSAEWCEQQQQQQQPLPGDDPTRSSGPDAFPPQQQRSTEHHGHARRPHEVHPPPQWAPPLLHHQQRPQPSHPPQPHPHTDTGASGGGARQLSGTRSQHGSSFRQSKDVITDQMLAVIAEISPTPEEERKRAVAVAFLEHVVKQRWPEARVEVYGSSASLFALRGADADATMIITGTTSGEAYVAEADRWDIVDEENDRYSFEYSKATRTKPGQGRHAAKQWQQLQDDKKERRDKKRQEKEEARETDGDDAVGGDDNTNDGVAEPDAADTAPTDDVTVPDDSETPAEDKERPKPDNWWAQNMIIQLARDLLDAGAMGVKPLPRARVPVVKFQEANEGASCDVCLDNVLATHNTQLLRTYARIDERVRPLVFIVKHWAKARQINSTYQGTLSSYAYVILVIFYLQRVNVLPQLQTLESPHAPPVRRSDFIVDGHDCYFCSDLAYIESLGYGRHNRSNTQSLGQLLSGFFQYYGREFNYRDQVVSIREGAVLSKEEKEWTPKKNSRRDRFFWFCMRGEFMRGCSILSKQRNIHLLCEPFLEGQSRK